MLIYKNIELHNVAELINNDDGSFSWMRVPSYVYTALESESGKRNALNSTGVELRFVLRGNQAVIRMCTKEGAGKFHVYRGGIQGGWQDHELHKQVGTSPTDFVIERSNNLAHLKVITEKSGYDWNCEVIRIIFDQGTFKIFDIVGDITPPKREQCPKKTILAYGSSITHGSNSLDSSHSWVSLLAHNLNMDARNLGMAGSCMLEPKMAEYIASEGEHGKWDIATLELGINVLHWEPEQICSRVENILCQVAGRNITKSVYVISPFYYCGEDFATAGYGTKWRKWIEYVINKVNLSNITYINGLDIIDNMSFISADEIHPNIYGVQQIADKLTKIIGNR